MSGLAALGLLALGLLVLGGFACRPGRTPTSEVPVNETPPTSEQARDDIPAWVAGGDRFALALLARLAAGDGNLFFAPVVADRPFLYLIRDTQTGQIVFLGRVLDPRG